VQLVPQSRPPSPPQLPHDAPLTETQALTDIKPDLSSPHTVSHHLCFPATDFSPQSLLGLTFSSIEKIFFTAADQIFTSSYENRTLLTSRLNGGLSMVLEPDFSAEVQLHL
jgi:hypothetical protein